MVLTRLHGRSPRSRRRILNMNLREYDWIVVNSSAGKDSQTSLRIVLELADTQHALDRVIVAHADLGRIEWDGCKELAERQVHLYSEKIPFWSMARPQGDFLDLVRARGKWPDSQNRLCTSSLKRDQIAKLFTELTAKLALPKGRAARILNCMGMRAEESPTRAKLQPFCRSDRSSNSLRIVDQWLPIHGLTVDQVWANIRASGVPHHHAYDLGMKRLSCRFCIFADKASLMLAGRHAPELLAEYVTTERAIGHTFRHGFRIEEIQEAIAGGQDYGPPQPFVM